MSIKPSRRVQVCGLSDVGKVREHNEDSLLIREPEDGDLLAKKGTLLLLADGMGGLRGGEVASRIAVETGAQSYYESAASPRGALEAAVRDANDAIFHKAHGEGGQQPMGSTITALALVEDRAVLAQVGDSRAYYYRDGEIRQITRDHSLVGELVDRGEMDADTARTSGQRNILTRGLGLHEELAVDLYEVVHLAPGDTFLLSSDGLHELVTEEELVATLRRNESHLQASCEELVSLARERGGPDNITIALARVEGSAEAASRPPQVTAGAGRLLPAAILGSFVAGCGLTLLLLQLRGTFDAAPAASDAPQVQAAVEALERGDPDDALDALVELRRLQEKPDAR